MVSSKGDRDMTTQSRLGTLAILAAVGLAATVSGCVIDDSNPSYSGNCTPTDIYVDWQLLDVNGTPITCAAAGVATMQATVNGMSNPSRWMRSRRPRSIPTA